MGSHQMRPFRREKSDTPLTNEAIDHSQVVGQLLFSDEADEDGVVTVDVIALSVRHPSGRSVPGSAFELRLRAPYDPVWAGLFERLLRRWSEENRIIGLDFGSGTPPVVTIRSIDCTLRLDLVTDSLI
jgi:hypothetical protein